MIKLLNDLQLTKNFKLSEFMCNDGSQELMLDMNLVNKLQLMREKLGKPIVVVSAYRNSVYNAKVGGAPKSQHVNGKAADIKVNGISPLDIAFVAESVGFKGIGVYTHDGNSFTHVDTRETKSYWKDAEGHKLISVSKL
jgi:uncharacterized protein YcbK (DUF882 family)